MELLVLYAMSFVGIPYKWGGANPMTGLDCSGLVQIILESAGEDPPKDQTAQALFDHFSDNGRWGIWKPGALAFYGRGMKSITHVGFMVDQHRMIEAAGGGSRIRSAQDARNHDAYVKMSLITKRRDLQAVIRPYYEKIGMF